MTSNLFSRSHPRKKCDSLLVIVEKVCIWEYIAINTHVSTHCGLVMLHSHLDLGPHWLGQYLGSRSTPSHYMIQWWLIFHWELIHDDVNGNFFCVTGPLWGESTGHKGQWSGALMFSLICTWTHGWVNNREASDLRRHRAHFDVTVMFVHASVLTKEKLFARQANIFRSIHCRCLQRRGTVWCFCESPEHSSPCYDRSECWYKNTALKLS